MVSKTANPHLNPPPRPTGSKGIARSSGVVTPAPSDPSAKPQARPQPRQRQKTIKPEGPLKKKQAARDSGSVAAPSSSALRRAAHKQALEQRILDAARELFASRGFEAVTLREVAAAVGYSHAMIYSFFADKRSLLARLGEEGSQGLVAVLAAQAGSLAGMVAAYLHWAAANPHHYRLLFSEPDGGSGSEGEVYALLRGLVQAPDVDLHAQILWAALHGAALLEIDRIDREGREGRESVPWRTLDARITALVARF